MHKALGDAFHFVASEPLPTERREMGYADLNTQYTFVIRSYESLDSYKKALYLGESSEVVIIGSAPEVFVSERIKHNKLTFRYVERMLKKGRWRITPRVIRSFYQGWQSQSNQVYILCASAYTAGDYYIGRAYLNKTYKWGYFPEVYTYNVDEMIQNKRKTRVSILWAGRFVSFKHPEKALYIADRLQRESVDFQLRLIGNGEMDKYLKLLSKHNSLSDKVEFMGYLPPHEVRKWMVDSDIFLFTSDFQEGWGAVLNEAMNSGCAIVANRAIGSVPFLITHEHNGMIYQHNDNDMLYSLVLRLIHDERLRHSLGKNAYDCITGLWNAKIAAERLLILSENILRRADTSTLYSDGPCSRAFPCY